MAHQSQSIKVDAFFKRDHPKFLYFKSLSGLALGLALGYLRVTGLLGFMCFLPLQYAVAQVYCTLLRVPDYMIDRVEMFTEQVFPALGLFVVTWTVCYTLFL